MGMIDAATATRYTQTTRLLDTSTERELIFNANSMGFQHDVLEAAIHGRNSVEFIVSHSIADAFMQHLVEQGYTINDTETQQVGIVLFVSWPEREVVEFNWDTEREEVQRDYLAWLNSGKVSATDVRVANEGFNGYLYLYWLDEHHRDFEDERYYFAPLDEIPNTPKSVSEK